MDDILLSAEFLKLKSLIVFLRILFSYNGLGHLFSTWKKKTLLKTKQNQVLLYCNPYGRYLYCVLWKTVCDSNGYNDYKAIILNV